MGVIGSHGGVIFLSDLFWGAKTGETPKFFFKIFVNRYIGKLKKSGSFLYTPVVFALWECAVKESKSDLRVEQEPGTWEVVSLSKISRWSGYLAFIKLYPFKSCQNIKYELTPLLKWTNMSFSKGKRFIYELLECKIRGP